MNHQNLHQRLFSSCPFGVLVVSKEAAGLWAASEKTLYTAQGEETLVEHLFGVGVSPSVLGHLLVGCVPEGQLEHGWRFRTEESELLGYSEKNGGTGRGGDAG